MSDINFLMGAVQQGGFTGQMRPSGSKLNDAANQHNRQAREACTEFEALFINMMLKELRATVHKSGLMDGGKAEELYTSLMDTQMSRDMAAQGGIGLAEMLYRQMMAADDSRQPEPDQNSTTDASNNEQVHILEK